MADHEGSKKPEPAFSPADGKRLLHAVIDSGNDLEALRAVIPEETRARVTPERLGVLWNYLGLASHALVSGDDEVWNRLEKALPHAYGMDQKDSARAAALACIEAAVANYEGPFALRDPAHTSYVGALVQFDAAFGGLEERDIHEVLAASGQGKRGGGGNYGPATLLAHLASKCGAFGVRTDDDLELVKKQFLAAKSRSSAYPSRRA